MRRRGYVFAEEVDAYVVFRAIEPEVSLGRFPVSEDGFPAAQALFRSLVGKDRTEAVRVTLVWAATGGIVVSIVSSFVFGASLSHLGVRGWQGYAATGSLSVSEISAAIWRSALAILILVWLIHTRTPSGRRALELGLASVAVAGLVVWVVSECVHGVLTAPPNGISGTPVDILVIAVRVRPASLAVWTGALAALALMWLVRATEPQR